MHPLNEASVELTYERNGEKHNATVNPVYVKSYMLGFYYAESEKPIVDRVIEGYPMEAAGFQKGDVITGINGEAFSTRDEMMTYLEQHPLTDEAIVLNYERGGVANTATVTPKLEGQYYSMGFGLEGVNVKAKGIEVVKYGLIEVKYNIVTTVESLGMLISGKVKANELAGPVGIVDMIGSIYQDSKVSGFTTIFLNLAAFSVMLSANLGVMNLLPIPALDGGRLVFLLIEVFRGKPVDQSKEGMVHMIGFIALMILMVFVMFNDISRIF
jgi:regulator of sigma E protease